MSEPDFSIDTEMDPTTHRPQLFRYLNITLITVCGIIIALVIMSHPNINGRIMALMEPPAPADQPADTIVPPAPVGTLPLAQEPDNMTDLQGTPAAEPSESVTPSVAPMPRNRVPVSRGTAPSGN